MWITNLLGLVLCGAEDTLLRSGSPSDTDGERSVGFALPRVIFGGGELLPGRVLGAPLWSEGWGVPEGTSVSCASAKVQSFLHIIPRPLANIRIDAEDCWGEREPRGHGQRVCGLEARDRGYGQRECGVEARDRGLRRRGLWFPSIDFLPRRGMCTRVYTMVYPRVHNCILTCTQPRSRYVRRRPLVYTSPGLMSRCQVG